MARINFGNDKLPIENNLASAIAIYLKRLGVLFVVIIANFIILSLILIIDQISLLTLKLELPKFTYSIILYVLLAFVALLLSYILITPLRSLYASVVLKQHSLLGRLIIRSQFYSEEIDLAKFNSPSINIKMHRHKIIRRMKSYIDLESLEIKYAEQRNFTRGFSPTISITLNFSFHDYRDYEKQRTISLSLGQRYRYVNPITGDFVEIMYEHPKKIIYYKR